MCAAQTIRTLPTDCPQHQSVTQIETMQKLTFTLQTIRRRRDHRPRLSSDRPTSRADRPFVEKLDKLEGDGFGKMHF